ncbi:uncharacterized protein TNCT_527881 [Trichonephila clavata]|uniref:Ig-like domain-containing protein n=1 Tax=Trichonephila clavata TaxID=2740835 RepID=A0A8X6FHS2_TRICU|nr:uncharacterized protein TNCT_527881 [Trichonephila clavata]
MFQKEEVVCLKLILDIYENEATSSTGSGRRNSETKQRLGVVHVEPSAHNILGLELVVEEVRYRDQGVFTCSAVVDGREITIKFTLKVYLSIMFWDTPEVQIGKEGTDYMIMCNVRADPSPIVSWYVNDSLIFDATVTLNLSWGQRRPAV